MVEQPTPFVVFGDGSTYLHGTKAALGPGDLLSPGRASNFELGRITNFVYVTRTLDAAAWGAELARGSGAPRIFVVEPLGPIEDDPNVTDKRFPGNPTQSFRTADKVRVVQELEDWTGHTLEQIQAMRQGLAELERTGQAIIDD